MMAGSAFIRRDINSQIQAALDEAGVAGEFRYSDEHQAMRWHIRGEVLTPGQAADKYLPGGFSGNFGRGL